MHRTPIALALAVIVAACASTPQPTPSRVTSVPDPVAVASPAAPSTTPSPAPRGSAPAIASTSTAAAAMIPLVPVVGFWSTRMGISRAQLDAALAGTSTIFRRSSWRARWRAHGPPAWRPSGRR